MASPVHLVEGSVFAGDFRVVRLLSEGGMGAVYVAEQISTGKQRALKIMHPTLVHDPRQRQRFVQEAKIGARIESDHVVEVLGAGVEPATGMPWLAMELLQGETLDARLERGPLTRADLVEIFKQLCHALAAAHDVGIVHRDLKPENIYLAVPRREGLPFVVKILDFGIAKLVAESGNTTQAIGSPLWMAPEQTNAAAPISPATDVWALGLIAFACLTGHSYWRGAHAETPNPMTLVMEVCFDPLSAASERAAEYGVAHLLPPGFDEWFAQCVSRDVDARFKTARPVRGALERLLTKNDAIVTAPQSVPVVTAPRIVQPPLTPMEAPDLDIPVSKPKPEPKKAEPPKAQEPPKPAEPRKEAPPSRASQSGGHPAVPERIIIPPIKSTTKSREHERFQPVVAPPPKPFPWVPIAVVVGLILVGLFLAQKFFWTRPPPPPDQGPAHVASEEPKTKAPASPSATAPAGPCAPGMVRLPAGDLVAGDPTKHVATYCLDAHEVTVKAYAACVKSGKCTPAATSGNWTAINAEEKASRNLACNANRADRQDHPVNCVEHGQAEAYCKAQGKRLPTEPEWEWAVRSGPARYKFPWGFEMPDVQLCWSGFTKRTSTCAVGAYPKGSDSFGVMDLAGNVREWTGTAVGGDRVHCGSDWTDKGADDMFKLGYCGQAPRTSRSAFLGFRCAGG
ncbi:MAG: SUMF1/EgtB/PvdO family nonheme iron enzyme [Deltaproteobacteria bacterium]|nr:SUMF1/EgtB/PvdO family nonheme iron enzyme [Deltaproteobacteria bacterium]